jgi:hypothetical protein
MATNTTTVRVRRPSSELLQRIARAHETRVIDVVHDAIDALERREFLHGGSMQEIDRSLRFVLDL